MAACHPAGAFHGTEGDPWGGHRLVRMAPLKQGLHARETVVNWPGNVMYTLDLSGHEQQAFRPVQSKDKGA
jgi:hypothetical protein